MKDETKAKFEQAVAGYSEQAQRAKEVLEHKLTARQQFEAEWRNNRDGVVKSALEEIARDLLRPKGWQCHITSSDAEHSIKLEVYQGDMTATGSGKPCIKFIAEKSEPAIYIQSMTQSQGGADGRSIGVPLTEDVVHQYVLRFFQRLASEGPRQHF
jgi:hypothetical protein